MSKVAGRLANFIDNWLEITHDVVILNTISGYQIPFLQTPPSRPFLQEPRLSEVEERLCALEIGRLLAKGAIQHAAFAPDQYLSSYFLIDKKDEHINFLELKAVEYALKSFMSERRSLDLLLRIDNTTAIAYINKGGSSRFPKLSSLAKSIWQWCESRDIYLFASYIWGQEIYFKLKGSQQIRFCTSL